MNGFLIRHPQHQKGVECLYYFKKTYELHPKGTAIVRLMADARYKLYINGNFVALGPCKGSRHVRYYDEVDLAPYLKEGENLFEATVLTLKDEESMDVSRMHLCSVLRTGEAYFFMDGAVEEEQGETALVTDDTWEVAKELHDSFSYQFFVGMNEHVEVGFKTDLDFVHAEKMSCAVRTDEDYIPFGEVLSCWSKKNPLPPMMYEKGSFTFHDGYYDPGELMTGFIKLEAKGQGKIYVRYGECFVKGDNEHYVKGDRTDTTGHLLGHEDSFQVDGSLKFESFWFRTFRFVQVRLEGAVELLTFGYEKTGYPLALQSTYDFGEKRRNDLFDISFRTLQRCMQETYVDCPYYEQLQYCQDTYEQILYTYMVTDDMRLPRKALEDFGLTWRPGFITEARSPSCKRQYITGFALFYVLMVEKYELRTGDLEETRKYLPVVDGILDWFEHHKNQNGLIARSHMWDFVDWADRWTQKEGAPVVEVGVGITIYSLMYAYTLRRAAILMNKFGRQNTAKEYLKRAQKILIDVKAHTWDEAQQLFANSDKKDDFSQHEQIWAVLADLVKGNEAKDLLKRSCEMPEEVLGGYAFSYVMFRAYEHADCYELSEGMMEQYYGLLKDHCSTVPETPSNLSRSECHAWGAVALFEYATMTLGVKFSSDALHIEPYVKGIDHANGTVFTRFGRVDVSWTIQNEEFYLNVTVNQGISPKVKMPAGFKKTHLTVVKRP